MESNELSERMHQCQIIALVFREDDIVSLRSLQPEVVVKGGTAERGSR